MLGNIISAGASVLGGFLGRDSAKDQAAATERARQENIALQREFAQNGIQWRVEDAKKAGIHPIYALGSSGASFTPVSSAFAADTSLPNALASAGQDIGRAVNASRSGSQRVDAFTKAAQALQLEKGGLENEVLKLELASKAARLRQDATPPMPIGDRYLIPGQASAAVGGDGLIKNKPMERTPSDPGKSHSEPGAVTDVGYGRTSGGLFPIPGGDIKERIEDNWYQETMHFIRNNLLPMISPAFNDPPNVPLKPGMAWVYDPVYGYKQVPDKWHRKFIRN